MATKKGNPLGLSAQEKYILKLLTPPEKLSPSQMIERDIEIAKEKAKEEGREDHTELLGLNRNTIYVIVRRLEKRELLSAEQEEKAPGQKGRPRRFLSITPKGEYACALHDLSQAEGSYEKFPKLQALIPPKLQTPTPQS